MISLYTCTSKLNNSRSGVLSYLIVKYAMFDESVDHIMTERQPHSICNFKINNRILFQQM